MVEPAIEMYRGFEMIANVDGDATAGFYVATQTIRLTSQGTRMVVETDGVATGRFDTRERAFAASFRRMIEAVDNHLDRTESR
jgi:hypothetical protein